MRLRSSFSQVEGDVCHPWIQDFLTDTLSYYLMNFGLRCRSEGIVKDLRVVIQFLGNKVPELEVV